MSYKADSSINFNGYTTMDPNQYRFAYPFEQLVRSEYPTPPPSFSQYSSQIDEFTDYAKSYAYPPASPSIYSSGSYQSFVQSPNPLESLASPPLTSHFATSAGAESDEVDDTVSISTAFHPGLVPTPDTILSSSDGVMFYVHAKTILDRSPTSFERQLSAPLSDVRYRNHVIRLDASSVELNIILHTLYGTSPAVHSPDFDAIVRAVDRMPSYALSPEFLIRPSTPLYNLILSHAPLRPLDVYALAAHHGLSSLAISASSHLLSYDLSSITDAMAKRIGAVHLKKLLLLHMGRFSSLKAILLHPPLPHPPTKQCGFEDQKSLTRAWALVSAYLAWDARPDLSTHSMQTALNPLMEHLTCNLCHQSLKDRIKDVVIQWASVKTPWPAWTWVADSFLLIPLVHGAGLSLP